METKSKKGRIISIIIFVLLTICVTQGIFIYNKMNTQTAENRDIDEFSSFIREKFSTDTKNNWKNFDRFFSDDFFKGESDPFREMDRIHDQIRKMMEDSIGNTFDESWNSWFDDRFTVGGSRIEFDSDQTDHEYVYTLKVKAFKDNDIKIDIDENGIYIHGKFTQKLEKKDKSGNILHHQEQQQVISQTIPVPYDADYRKAEIKKKKDRIIIRIPKV